VATGVGTVAVGVTAGGALVGIGAILVVLFACRAAGAAAEARGRAKARS